MKILLTGHKGFIGSNFLNLCPKEWEVATYDWKDGPFEMFFDSVKGFDWVVHMGAISSTTETDVDLVMNQNLNFSIKLFEDCIKHNVNFQWSSSASVYGKTSSFKEVNESRPENLYAMSKHLFERYVNIRNPGNITYQGFRYFNVFGPNEDHKGDQASPVHKFTKQASSTGVIKLFVNSEHFKRDFVPVETVINAHVKLTKTDQCGIWNVGTGHAISFQQIAERIAARYDAKIELIPMPDNLKRHYQQYTRADVSKLNDTLQHILHKEILEMI